MFRWRVCTVKLEIQSEREIYWWNWSSRSSVGSEKIISRCGWVIWDTSRVDGTFLHLLFFPLVVLLSFLHYDYNVSISLGSSWTPVREISKHLHSLVPWPSVGGVFISHGTNHNLTAAAVNEFERIFKCSQWKLLALPLYLSLYSLCRFNIV